MDMKGNGNKKGRTQVAEFHTVLQWSHSTQNAPSGFCPGSKQPSLSRWIQGVDEADAVSCGALSFV